MKDAARMLSREASGSFMLRQNESGEYRITFKKNQRVEHLKIMKDESSFWIDKGDRQKFSSLRRLVEHLRDDFKMFDRPVRSAFHETPSRTSRNSAMMYGNSETGDAGSR